MSATVIGTPEYSNYIGSPITVPVTAANYAGATFHRVRLKVTVNGDSDNPFEFTDAVQKKVVQGVEVVQTNEFDISSALRAFNDNYAYTPDIPAAYPSFTAVCVACSDYMIDGEEHEGADPSTPCTISPLYVGALTDLERLSGTRPERYSRKPTSSPEPAFINSHLLVPGPTVVSLAPAAPTVEQVLVTAGLDAAHHVYGILAPDNGIELRFINSLGVHENVFLTCLKKREVNIHTDSYTIARRETLSQFSRGIARKQNDYETWTLSSGPLDQQWQSWYIHELLMASWVWIKCGSQWVACDILPEETVLLRDETQADLMHVEFKVRLDINGSPL